jgi:hypothetical protein
MKYPETEEFLTFRLKTFPPISAKELKDVLFQAVSLPEGLEKDVATIVFEERCMESINTFRKDLASVGYKELLVVGTTGFISEVRALPQIPTHSLWAISGKFFPVHTSRGSTAECDFQTVDIRFPQRLVHAYCLCEKCLL